MNFEFDPLRSKANQGKHGIDFVDVQALWNGPDLLEIPARTTDEPRFLVIAQIHGKHWSAVITPGLIQSASQAVWPELSAFGLLSRIAPSLCPKSILLQPISI